MGEISLSEFYITKKHLITGAFLSGINGSTTFSQLMILTPGYLALSNTNIWSVILAEGSILLTE